MQVMFLIHLNLQRWVLKATYNFQNGFSANTSIVDVDSTYIGYSQAVELPAYTLVNAGVMYQEDT